MLTHHAMLERLPVWGALEVSAKRIACTRSAAGFPLSVRGTAHIAVGADAKAETQIGAVLDVLNLHLNGGNMCSGQPVSGKCVTVILADGPQFIEVADAVGHWLVL